MLAIGIVFAISTWAVFFMAKALVIPFSVASACTAVLGLVLKQKRLRIFSLILLTVSVALVRNYFYTAKYLEPFNLISAPVEICGIIVDSKGYSNSASYRVYGYFPNSPHLPSTYIMLRVYSSMEYLPGDVIRCQLEPSPPRTSSLEKHYRSQGINITGNVVGEIEPSQNSRFVFTQKLIAARRFLFNNLYDKLPDETAAVVAKMVLRLGDGIPAKVYADLNRSGVVHLLSVSGLHLSILVELLLRLLDKSRLSQKAQAFAAIAAAILFTLLVGASASVVRACVMTVFMLLARLVSRRSDSLSSLGAALLIICLAWPYWTQSPGLWLSASATLGIILFRGQASAAIFSLMRSSPGECGKIMKAGVEALSVSLAAHVFTMPVLVMSNGWFSLVAPVTNVLISVFVPFVIAGGMLCAFIPGSFFPLTAVAWVTDFSTKCILWGSSLLAQIPFATFSFDHSYLLIWLVALLLIVGLVCFFRENRRLLQYGALCCALLLCVGAASFGASHRNKVEVVSLADCSTTLVIRGYEAVLLGKPDKFEISRLIDYLHFRNISRISAIIAPELGDKIDSALLQLAENFTISCVVGPDDAFVLSELQDMTGLPAYSCGYANIQALGGVLIQVSETGGEIMLQIGGQKVLKFSEEYAIMNQQQEDILCLYKDNFGIIPKGLPVAVEPVGAYIFGETRVLVDI